MAVGGHKYILFLRDIQLPTEKSENDLSAKLYIRNKRLTTYDLISQLANTWLYFVFLSLLSFLQIDLAHVVEIFPL